MTYLGNPDAMTGVFAKQEGRAGDNNSPPRGKPWIWLTYEMLSSLAWRSLSANGRRLLDFLLVEHCRHAGRRNGELLATHKQLREYGLTADCIRKAIDECVVLGFVECQHGGRWAKTNRPSTYRLTFYEDCNGNAATNDWKLASARLEVQGKVIQRRPRRRTTKHFNTASSM